MHTLSLTIVNTKSAMGNNEAVMISKSQLMTTVMAFAKGRMIAVKASGTVLLEYDNY